METFTCNVDLCLHFMSQPIVVRPHAFYSHGHEYSPSPICVITASISAGSDYWTHTLVSNCSPCGPSGWWVDNSVSLSIPVTDVVRMPSPGRVAPDHTDSPRIHLFLLHPSSPCIWSLYSSLTTIPSSHCFLFPYCAPSEEQ